MSSTLYPIRARESVKIMNKYEQRIIDAEKATIFMFPTLCVTCNGAATR